MADNTKTISQLREQAQKVKNETEVGGNTAERVGGLFEGIVDKLGEHENLHVVLSESEYEASRKDESKFYFVYEDDV